MISNGLANSLCKKDTTPEFICIVGIHFDKISFLGLYSDFRLLFGIVRKTHKQQTHTYTEKEIVRVNNKKKGGQLYVA